MTLLRDCYSRRSRICSLVLRSTKVMMSTCRCFTLRITRSRSPGPPSIAPSPSISAAWRLRSTIYSWARRRMLSVTKYVASLEYCLSMAWITSSLPQSVKLYAICPHTSNPIPMPFRLLSMRSRPSDWFHSLKSRKLTKSARSKILSRRRKVKILRQRWALIDKKSQRWSKKSLNT